MQLVLVDLQEGLGILARQLGRHGRRRQVGPRGGLLVVLLYPLVLLAPHVDVVVDEQLVVLDLAVLVWKPLVDFPENKNVIKTNIELDFLN